MPFQIALSGLNAASSSLNTTANNIANVNTVGFKKSRANFVELFATGLQNVSANATGLGARPSSIQQQFGQGSLDFTDNNLDLALVGGGFFTLNDAEGSPSYTRAGNFGVDRNGFVVNDQGLRLQAFPPLAATGQFNTGSLQDLQLDTTDNPPSATGLVNAGLNLPADAEILDPALFDPEDASTFNNTTSVTVFDSLGTSHTATYYFVRSSAAPSNPDFQNWEVFLEIDGDPVGSAVLEFDQNGQLQVPAGGEVTFPPWPVPNPNADPIELTTNFNNATQFGTTFNVNSLTQNGFASGRLVGVEITQDGIVFARFTNGQSTPLGQLAITDFANPEGLENLGDTRWAETFESGEGLRGAANSGSLGVIQAGALETANVDLAAELVNMITAQRTFQANAQMISTADNITQTIINIR